MIRTELTLRLQNSPGALARVCDLLAAERINITAMMLEPTGTMRLMVDNPTLAAGILRERHYDISQRDALVVHLGSQAGTFAAVARLLSSAEINLEYAYATVSETLPQATVVIGVTDAIRAASAAGL
jgi:hypothetical protein